MEENVTSISGILLRTYEPTITYCNVLSAGPETRTSLTAMLGSPEAKCGLSRPPDTAIPNPYPGTLVTVICLYSHPLS